ncbi:GNAT family N-acetyltransferase [Lentilactobacillus diolivorans]|uniref:GNAT family N-acetyltransferase n=1 Tax=Lentilactobacillus diolivorans TaxID=179838 RepID=UPI002469197F|nr:GNAT family N-acetyltransferase [Lentilactobacillus diolivorans]MDH5106221.1 GNAT family N-acetyltransferase [Lentilactobacillus diolivorans]
MQAKENHNFNFEKATVDQVPTIVKMYQASFAELYHRYHDDATSPYKESAESITQKLQHSNSSYYFIISDKLKVGLIRVVTTVAKKEATISPLLVLPKFQGQKIAQRALQQIELQYPTVKIWYIDTIKQEPKLVHLYLKCGYKLIPDKIQTIKNGMDIVFFRKFNQTS